MRRIDIDGCLNFRDLGGYPAAGGRTVRWRTLFRGDALHHVTPLGATRIREDLRIVTAIDLRTAEEAEAVPDPGLSAKSHHLPLLDVLRRPEGPIMRVDRSPRATADRYLGLLRAAGDRFVAVVRILADPGNHPAVFYCAAGKDRTGLVAAVLLGLLTVPDEEIVRDYALTSETIDAVIDRLSTLPVYGPGIDGVPRAEFHPAPETMAIVLEDLGAEYGSVEGYALANGIDRGTIGMLRDALLDQP